MPNNGLVATNSGRLVSLIHPRVEQIHLADIAHHLSFINRWIGASEIPVSVASHSLFVANLVAKTNPGAGLNGLMHDAAEAYTGDISRPLRKILGSSISDIEHNLNRVIYEKFDLIYPMSPGIQELVQSCDDLAGACEARTFLHPPIEGCWDWISELPIRTHTPFAHMTPAKAKADFLRAFTQYHREYFK